MSNLNLSHIYNHTNLRACCSNTCLRLCFLYWPIRRGSRWQLPCDLKWHCVIKVHLMCSCHNGHDRTITSNNTSLVALVIWELLFILNSIVNPNVFVSCYWVSFLSLLEISLFRTMLSLVTKQERGVHDKLSYDKNKIVSSRNICCLFMS